MKTRKTTGFDEITAEMIRSLNLSTIETILQLCKDVLYIR